MTFSLYSMAVDTFVPMLRTLSTLLDEAAAHAREKKREPEVSTWCGHRVAAKAQGVLDEFPSLVLQRWTTLVTAQRDRPT